jgi:hypothetical protein
VTSLSTTTMALGLVRPAQGRFDERSPCCAESAA